MYEMMPAGVCGCGSPLVSAYRPWCMVMACASSRLHLNLHKTFAIPHGGGGPGMGPIGVKKPPGLLFFIFFLNKKSSHFLRVILLQEPLIKFIPVRATPPWRWILCRNLLQTIKGQAYSLVSVLYFIFVVVVVAVVKPLGWFRQWAI